MVLEQYLFVCLMNTYMIVYVVHGLLKSVNMELVWVIKLSISSIKKYHHINTGIPLGKMRQTWKKLGRSILVTVSLCGLFGLRLWFDLWHPGHWGQGRVQLKIMKRWSIFHITDDNLSTDITDSKNCKHRMAWDFQVTSSEEKKWRKGK